jgi:hypothetical protein
MSTLTRDGAVCLRLVDFKHSCGSAASLDGWQTPSRPGPQPQAVDHKQPTVPATDTRERGNLPVAPAYEGQPYIRLAANPLHEYKALHLLLDGILLHFE